MKNKKVLIIHTGGTIGMKNTESGYQPAVGFLAGELAELGDMARADFPCWELYEMSPLLDSSNVALAEWNKIASLIYEVATITTALWFCTEPILWHTPHQHFPLSCPGSTSP